MEENKKEITIKERLLSVVNPIYAWAIFGGLSLAVLVTLIVMIAVN